MKYANWIFIIGTIISFSSCKKNQEPQITKQPIYEDHAYLQDFSVKFNFEQDDLIPQKVVADRNGIIQILASNKLFRTNNGHFQYPGNLVSDNNFIPMADMRIADAISYQNQFVYLTDKAVLSNAWAGKLLSKHNLPMAKVFCGGNDFDFLITNGKTLVYLKDSQTLWSEKVEDENIISIKYDKSQNLFFILSDKSFYTYSSDTNKFSTLCNGIDLTCFEISKANKNLIIGTNKGYFTIDFQGANRTELNNKLPWTELTSIIEIQNDLWFASTKGAFMLRKDGKFNYYHGKRWLPGNRVKDISAGPDNSVLILTDKGLGQIVFKKMTLEDKAMVFEDQVRKRHIRYGVNSYFSKLKNHDLSTSEMGTASSDNLWTSMYMASQLFRYLSTGSDEAKQNCYESFEALERFHTINNIQGLFGRSFERSGYKKFEKEYRAYVDTYWYPDYNNNISWHRANKDWDWRGTSSSDQTVGQIFAMTLIAEYIDDPAWKKRAVKILDDLMSYIVKNDFCLVDVDGKPSLWGRWSPEYLNRLGTMIGDRKLYSSNIIAFLQSAYKHTGKEIFKENAFELINEHGYLENLTRSLSEIRPAPEDADEWSKMLSQEWNHGDDEMYFLAYWSLYPDAFNGELKEQYRKAIKEHWEYKRPDKIAHWNFCYAMTGAVDFDLEESIWTLKEWPLDMIGYAVENSHRKDIELIESNFRGQITKELLPPDERASLRQYQNLFVLDAKNSGGELSAGETFLLPYWMGRYLGIISEPVKFK